MARIFEIILQIFSELIIECFFAPVSLFNPKNSNFKGKIFICKRNHDICRVTIFKCHKKNSNDIKIRCSEYMDGNYKSISQYSNDSYIDVDASLILNKYKTNGFCITEYNLKNMNKNEIRDLFKNHSWFQLKKAKS
jgi:hypothetical protein